MEENENVVATEEVVTPEVEETVVENIEEQQNTNVVFHLQVSCFSE